MLKTGLEINKLKNQSLGLDKWDDDAITEWGFAPEQWKEIREHIDKKLPPLTPEFLKNWHKDQLTKLKKIREERKRQKRHRKSSQETRHNVYKNEDYQQIYYREKILKEQMKLRGWTPINGLNNNYLTLALKKTDQINHKYIYNFLNFTRINSECFEGNNSWYTLFK